MRSARAFWHAGDVICFDLPSCLSAESRHVPHAIVNWISIAGRRRRPVSVAAPPHRGRDPFRCTAASAGRVRGRRVRRRKSGLKLIDDDYQILRGFRERSSLRTYLSTVVERLFLDYRIRQWGKWRPSAQARRAGALAVRLEALLHRDGVPFEAGGGSAAGDASASRPRAPRSKRFGARLPPRITAADRGRRRPGRFPCRAVPWPNRPCWHGRRAAVAARTRAALAVALSQPAAAGSDRRAPAFRRGADDCRRRAHAACRSEAAGPAAGARLASLPDVAGGARGTAATSSPNGWAAANGMRKRREMCWLVRLSDRMGFPAQSDDRGRRAGT